MCRCLPVHDPHMDASRPNKGAHRPEEQNTPQKVTARTLLANPVREFTSPPSLGTLAMLATQPLSPPCYLKQVRPWRSPRIHVTTLARHTGHARDAAALTAVLLEAGSTLEIPGPSELRDAYFLAATSNREFTSPPSLGTLVMLATQPLSPPCFLQPPTAHRRVDLQAIFQVSRRCFPTESLANRPCVTCVAELAAIHLATLHR